MSASRRAASGNTDHASVNEAVREVIELSVAEHGTKRGLYRAAEILGVSERWLRAFRFGEPARVSAETFLRAVEARRVLRAERRARLLRELEKIGDEPDAAMAVGARDLGFGLGC